MADCTWCTLSHCYIYIYIYMFIMHTSKKKFIKIMVVIHFKFKRTGFPNLNYWYPIHSPVEGREQRVKAVSLFIHLKIKIRRQCRLLSDSAILQHVFGCLLWQLQQSASDDLAFYYGTTMNTQWFKEMEMESLPLISPYVMSLLRQSRNFVKTILSCSA